MFTLTKSHKGHQFAVTLSGVSPVCELVNGATGYEARASFYRDGAHIGDAAWDPEGFVPGGPFLMPDTDDSEDVYRALQRAVRERLATLDGSVGGSSK